MFDAIVLAGGQARRLGGADKPALSVGGRTLLERVLDAVADASVRVVVGPGRDLPPGVLAAQERPPGGGPVAAIAAGLAVATAPVVVVLAADLPDVAPAVPRLLDAVTGHDVALLTDSGGRPNYLAAAWARAALADAVGALGDPAGAPARRLVEGRDTVTVADPAGWGSDCDTWDDLAAARLRHDDR